LVGQISEKLSLLIEHLHAVVLAIAHEYRAHADRSTP